MSATDPNREQLVTIVRRVCAAEGTEEEIEQMLQCLHAAVPHVRWTDLIYWPCGFPHNPNVPEPTADQIVDRALSTKPNVIIIPPSAEPNE